MPVLTEVREEIAAKSRDLALIFEQAGSDIDLSRAEALKGLEPAAMAAEVKRRNDELTELGKKRDGLVELEEIGRKARDEHARNTQAVNRLPFPGVQTGGDDRSASAVKRGGKSLGTAFVESDGYKGWSPRRQQSTSYEDQEAVGFKATFGVSDATLTAYDRVPGLIVLGTQRLTVADLLAKGQTTMPTIRYVREDSYTNAATVVAEGATKPEASWDTSEQDAPVRKIAVTAKVTDELFADFPAMRDYIDQRMPLMVRQTEEAEILNGSGSAPHLTGIMQTGGIQTQAKGSDPVPDAIYKAMIKVMTVGFFDPDGVVMHPLDWQDVRLLRDANGNYIWGSPAELGPERIWSLPVVSTTAQTQNTGLVGAFKLGAQIFYRQGVMIETTNSNEDDFKKNLIAVRAEERLALAVYRSLAFCTVTSI